MKCWLAVDFGQVTPTISDAKLSVTMIRFIAEEAEPSTDVILWCDSLPLRIGILPTEVIAAGPRIRIH
jgi:hypothetical protein